MLDVHTIECYEAHDCMDESYLKAQNGTDSYAVKVTFPLQGGAAASVREQGCGGREKLGGGARTSGMLELSCFLI